MALCIFNTLGGCVLASLLQMGTCDYTIRHNVLCIFLLRNNTEQYQDDFPPSDSFPSAEDEAALPNKPGLSTVLENAGKIRGDGVEDTWEPEFFDPIGLAHHLKAPP